MAAPKNAFPALAAASDASEMRGENDGATKTVGSSSSISGGEEVEDRLSGSGERGYIAGGGCSE
jgi:hypothetical protein